jgi:hypothetical protein
MWPPTDEEGAELGARAERMLAGLPEPRPPRGGDVGGDRADDGAPATGLAPS